MEIEKSIPEPSFSPFDLLSNDIKCIILDFLSNNDTKSFSLVCRSFYAIESHHRNLLKPLRLDHFKKVLNRYPNVSNVDLSLCSSVTDALLDLISSYYKEKLRSINFSRRNFYSHVGLTNLVIKCENLVEIDLSMDTKLDDLAAEAIAEAKNLEKLRLVSCASITDVELGYIAVGCSKLKLLSLRCCLGVSDLGVILIAVNCRDIRSLDLSYLRITSKCLPQILELQHLEDLVLEGCEGIVDDSFAAPKQGCISLKKLVISGSEKVRPVCLSSLTSGAADSLQQLILSCSKIDLALVDSLQKFSVLQCISIECCKVTCAGRRAFFPCY